MTVTWVPTAPTSRPRYRQSLPRTMLLIHSTSGMKVSRGKRSVVRVQPRFTTSMPRLASVVPASMSRSTWPSTAVRQWASVDRVNRRRNSVPSQHGIPTRWIRSYGASSTSLRRPRKKRPMHSLVTVPRFIRMENCLGWVVLISSHRPGRRRLSHRITRHVTIRNASPTIRQEVWFSTTIPSRLGKRRPSRVEPISQR